MEDVFLGVLRVSIKYPSKSFVAETTAVLTPKDDGLAETHFGTDRGRRRHLGGTSVSFGREDVQRGSVFIGDGLLAFLCKQAIMDDKNAMTRGQVLDLLSALSHRLEKLEQVEENEP